MHGDVLNNVECAVSCDRDFNGVIEDALVLLRERDGRDGGQAQRRPRSAQRSTHEMRTGTAGRCSLSAW